MLTLEFSFLTGRYHGTAWDRHVNEAEVAWPPDPWRLCRALAAVWIRKLTPGDLGRDQLVELLVLLSKEAPGYFLPPSIHFHTRHYMPVREGKKDRPKLIFDAFVQLDRRRPLIVHWPNLALSVEQEERLDLLLQRLGYLGRAESWVDAKRLNNWTGECNCVPETWSGDAGRIEDPESVTLWLPDSPENYKEKRERIENEVLESREFLLKTCQKKEMSKRKPGSKKARRIPLPQDWLDALIQDTAVLQKAGWTVPPLTRQIRYFRPKDVVRFMAEPPAMVLRRPAERRITTARYALYGKPLPRITEALRVAEQVRAAVMGYAKNMSGGDIPAVLCGHGKEGKNDHRHAFYLPEDCDGDGRIDHIVVYAAQGFDVQSRKVLAGLTTVRTKSGINWNLLLEGLGDEIHFQNVGCSLLGEARCWQSVTPYLHPWHRKKRFGVADQIRKECRIRGLAQPEEIRWIEGEKPRPVEFRRFRSKRGLTQPDRRGCFVRLVFPDRVKGPIALGFGCHFGLGMFRPV